MREVLLSILVFILLCLALCFLPPHVYGADTTGPNFRDSTKWLVTRVRVASMLAVDPQDHSTFICVFGTTYFYTEVTDHDVPMVGAEIFSRTNPGTPIYKEWGITNQPLIYGLRTAKQWRIVKDHEAQIVVKIYTTKPTPNNTEFALTSSNGKKQVSIPLSSRCTKAVPQPPVPPQPSQDTCPDTLPDCHIGNLVKKLEI